MKEVGVLEAKTHFSALLDEVSGGAEVTITRHGRPIARLSPVELQPHPPADIAERVRAVRAEIERACGVDEDFDWKAAVEEGRL